MSRSSVEAPLREPPRPPNPDPAQFEILRWEQVGQSLAVEVRYPGCSTYEGRKVMVFERCRIEELRALKTLDPHFAPVAWPGTRVPQARFRPTALGWRLARIVAAAL